MPAVRLGQFIGAARSFGIFDRPLTIRRAERYNFGYYPNGISSSSDYHRAQKPLAGSAYGNCGALPEAWELEKQTH
jgi:hypothetical protein